MAVHGDGTTTQARGSHTIQDAPPSDPLTLFTNQQQPQDRILHLLPLHHLHGVVNKLLCVLYAGGVVEFPREGQTRAADILRRLASWEKEDERLTLFMAVPTIYSLLMEGASYAYIRLPSVHPPTSDLNTCPPIHPVLRVPISTELESGSTQVDAATQAAALEGFRRLRLMVSGSAALPQTLFHKWEQRTGHRLLERYGTTEAGFIYSNPLEGVPRLPGFVGQPLPGVQARLVDPATEEEVGPGVEGEVRVKGPQVFSRYHGRPQATAEASDAAGWYRTGDLAVLDAAKGSVRVLGRISADILKSAGYKISALDVEAAILEALPRVAEAVVVGRPHPKWGDDVVAVCRLSGEEETLTLAELQEALGPHLAHYKMPRALFVVDRLPKNPMGKVNKKTLLAELGVAEAAAPAGAQ